MGSGQYGAIRHQIELIGWFHVRIASRRINCSIENLDR